MSFLDIPITPSKKYVDGFKDLMKTNYNVDYTDEEAFEGAYNLLNFFNLLLKLDKKLFLERKKLINGLKNVKIYKEKYVLLLDN